MQIDPELVNKLINSLPYPISTDDLIQRARQFGVSDQILGMLEHLPKQTFNSPQDVQNLVGGLSNLPNLGNLGGLGDLFKR
ncbi:DUF2795 domain-containing protein [Ktedonosporobacter rubrisoli]|nr:DUF2795 domain-containing protein [Ktedonosporobacter rubrisoli]